jgi:hypothetical protein
MATNRGRFGVIRANDTAIGEVRSYTIRQTAELVEDTYIGLAEKTFFSTIQQWQGSIECFWDETDAGQILFQPGTEVEMKFYPDAVDGDYYVGSALIVSKRVIASFDGMIEASIDLLGTTELLFLSDSTKDNLELEDGENLLLESGLLMLLEQ